MIIPRSHSGTPFLMRPRAQYAQPLKRPTCLISGIQCPKCHAINPRLRNPSPLWPHYRTSVREPLALINPEKSLDEAIEKANSRPYALAAYAFTRSARNADRLADRVESGNRSINNFVASIAETPYGGIKESGYGREGGTEGLTHYTVVKNVSHLML